MNWPGIANGMRSGIHGRAGVGVTDSGSSHHSDFTNDFAGNCRLRRNFLRVEDAALGAVSVSA
jgi:hypothetical protein